MQKRARYCHLCLPGVPVADVLVHQLLRHGLLYICTTSEAAKHHMSTGGAQRQHCIFAFVSVFLVLNIVFYKFCKMYEKSYLVPKWPPTEYKKRGLHLVQKCVFVPTPRL